MFVSDESVRPGLADCSQSRSLQVVKKSWTLVLKGLLSQPSHRSADTLTLLGPPWPRVELGASQGPRGLAAQEPAVGAGAVFPGTGVPAAGLNMKAL